MISTTHGFRYPLGGLEMYPLWIKGSLCNIFGHRFLGLGEWQSVLKIVIFVFCIFQTSFIEKTGKLGLFSSDVFS